MLLLGSSRRRRILFSAVALAAGGYASYRVYKSSAVSRRRKQLMKFISSLSFLGEAVSQSAESLAVISNDLKSFLGSDTDTVPRSLRQAFKIGQCPELRETVTVLSAALTQGLLRGVRANCKEQRHGAFKLEGFKGSGHGKSNLGSQVDLSEDAACREIREVSFTTKGHDEGIGGNMKSSSAMLAEEGCLECEEKREMIPSGEVQSTVEERFDAQKFLFAANLSGVDDPSKRSRKVGIMLDRAKRGPRDIEPSEDLPERLLAKLFSEPGVGFASAVAGTLARSCVIALFDCFQNRPTGIQCPLSRDPVSSLGEEPATDGEYISTKSTDKKTLGHLWVVDVICTEKCKALISECIQNFVCTTVSVYIDKTKDVNFYDDMVAGLTNPSHQAPMKDVLTSVCNGAVDTLVRTWHDVRFVETSGQSGSHTHCQEHQQEVCEALRTSEVAMSPMCSENHISRSQLSAVSAQVHYQDVAGDIFQSFTSDPCSSSGSPAICEVDTRLVLKANKESAYQTINGVDSKPLCKFQGNNSGMHSFIDGLSKTLAIPSNRKLVVDVAGTMTSEAVRSFIDVVVSTVKSHFNSKVSGRCNKGESDVQGCQLQARFRKGTSDAAIKAFLLGSICVAVCLHMLMGVRALESL